MPTILPFDNHHPGEHLEPMEHRTRKLNDARDGRGSCVIYWMQQAQRAGWNHALEHAITVANEKKVPLYVFFGLDGSYPGANARHFTFMLQGLAETSLRLGERGIGFILRICDPPSGAVKLASELDACSLITDCGHLRIQRQWRRSAADSIAIPFTEVETDMVVPAWTASDKRETAAWTLRKKLVPQLDWFMKPVIAGDPHVDSSSHSIPSLDPSDVTGLLGKLSPDRSVKPSERFTGGASEAEKRWRRFLDEKLPGYEKLAREPGTDGTSLMSPYLHFGQISPVRMALEARERGSSEAFLEQLVVRRELAINMVHYSENYDMFSIVPGWAKKTLDDHIQDTREGVYSLEELDGWQTSDEYWNAAQREMVETGHMHGYMRMYWGKKVIQWAEDPKTAFLHLVYLNDRYQLDGRDPCSYAGIAWCFGMHDRPFGTFPVTGNLRRLGSSLPKMRKARSSRYNRYLKRISSRFLR